jgi:4-alpha-glucanotransferase
MRSYTRSDANEPHWELIRLAMLSVSDQAIIPLQDYMNLGTDHRMNLPGTVGKNWKWSYTDKMLQHIDIHRIKKLIYESNRKFRKVKIIADNEQISALFFKRNYHLLS